MEPHDVVRLPADTVAVLVHGRDVRLITRDQVLTWFISAIDALQAGLFLDSGFRHTPDQHHRPGTFSCGCYLYGHAPGKPLGGRSLYFAVGTTGGQILIFDERRVAALVDAYGPQEEVSALAGLAPTPSEYHLDHPGRLHAHDGRFVSLDARRSQATVWRFRGAEMGDDVVRERLLTLPAAGLHLLLLPCQPWLVVAGGGTVTAVSVVDESSTLLHQCEEEAQVEALQYCHGTVIAIAISRPHALLTVVCKDVTTPSQTCEIVQTPAAGAASVTIAGRHPAQFLLVPDRHAVLLHPLGASAAATAPPLGPARRRPVNLAGTAHHDEVFALHGHLPAPDPTGLAFRPLHIRFTADADDARRCLEPCAGGHRLCLRTLIGEFEGEVTRLAYSHCLRWLLVTSSAGVLYTAGPNPAPLAPQWNRAPPALLRPLLARALHRHFGPPPAPPAGAGDGPGTDAPARKRRYRAL